METTNAQIKSALRMLFLRSKERAECMKRENYTCQECKKKQSTAKGKEFKVQVHHKEGVCNWEEIYAAIRKNLLCSPDKMEVLCKADHMKKEGKQCSQ
jgi:hypothetical protein